MEKTFYILAYLVITFYVILSSIRDYGEVDGEWIFGLNFLNPILWYQNVPVNWFGAIFICLVVNIVFAPYAVFYWLYKLCTVGRRK